MRSIIYFFILVFANSIIFAEELVGLAYAAQKAAELKKLQRNNKIGRPKLLVGPAYAQAQQKHLRSIQRQNVGYWGTAPVGPAYAASNFRIKANQRVFNGTWTNNTYWFRRPTVYIKGPYRNTPSFRSLSDPYMGFSS